MDFPKRIILSRKGFDSKYGKIPSPIIDGKLISLPIPEDPKHTAVRTAYSELPSSASGYRTYADILYALGKGSIAKDRSVHLDPDISKVHHPSLTGWKPMFGQSAAAQGLLKKYVAPGDLFLFFGWFRKAQRQTGGRDLRYFGDHMHVIHGWLQIEKTLDPKTQPPPYERCEHPHFIAPDRENNAVYLARERLSFADFPGAGAFPEYNDVLRLTDTCESDRRTYWRLPSFFFCDDSERRMTYHKNREWRSDGTYAYVHSASIGQEFVFDVSIGTRAAREWLAQLLATLSPR